MKIKDFEIPRSLEEARDMLRKLGPAGFPIAGGTSALFLRNEQKTCVDINRLGLAGIHVAPDGFEIGATTTIADLQAFAASGWVLGRVADHFVTQQVRNVSTLGGNVARVFAWADFPVALLALDASFVVKADVEKVFDAVKFFDGQPARLLAPGDLLASVRIPSVSAPCGFGYRKITRTCADYSMATAAAWVRTDGRKIAEARVAVGAAVTMPRRMTVIEKELAGGSTDAGRVGEIVARGWEGTIRKAWPGLAEDYVRHVAKVAVRDAIVEAAGGAS